MKLTKKQIIAVTVLCFLIILFFGWSSDNSRYLKVEEKPFNISIHTLGQLESEQSLHIGCPSIRNMWRYTITFLAKEGKKVKKGEMVLSFDSKSLMEKLTVKQSELKTAEKELERNRITEQETLDNLVLQFSESKADLEKKRRKADMPEDLLSMNDGKISDLDLNLALNIYALNKSRIENQKTGMITRINQIENKVKRLKSEVQELNQDIMKMNVKAPEDGIVVYTQNWNGEKKAVGDSTWMGESILELPNLNQMEVNIQIPEHESGKVKTGQDVEIILDSSPELVFKGTIKSLGRVYRTKSYDRPNIIIDGIVSILNPNPELMRPGMATSCDIIVSKKDAALVIPQKALILNDENYFVYTTSWFGKQTLVPVKPGNRSGSMVEILKGLKKGDSIMILSDLNKKPNGFNGN